MSRKLPFILLIFLALPDIHGEIPQNVSGGRHSVVYEIIDEEKCRITVSIGNARHEDILYYSMTEDGETTGIPLPVYLGAYKDAVILLRGHGFSYRNLIVYRKAKNSIIRKEYENALSMDYLPREAERYVFMYGTNPVLIVNSWESLDFVKIGKKIKRDVPYIEIFSDEIVLHIENSNERLKLPLK